jgi:hypothetical protein
VRSTFPSCLTSIAGAGGNHYLAFNFLLDMVGFKYLTCSLFAFAALFPLRINSLEVEPKKACGEIIVSEKLIHSTNNLPNGEIHLSFEDKNEQYTLFLFGDIVSRNQLDIKSEKILGLEKGSYTLIIQSKAGCKKQLKITIK